MKLLEHLPLWNHAAIRVLDIRQAVIQPGESMRAHLPASAFLFIDRGQAQVLIDGFKHIVNCCYVCHAGKGASLDIVQVDEELDYYLIFYKAAIVLPCRQELLRLYQENNPFQVQYGFAPAYPLSLYTRIEQMHRQWQVETQLEKFHVRALFHQLIYELLQQFHNYGGGQVTRPDLVKQAIRYMEEHYAEPLSLQELASVLQYGARQLQRQFKARLHISPMEYLIQIRMHHSQAMLLNTNAPLREISEAAGYTDSYYFSRAFKKYCGVSPIQYRRNCRISASGMSQTSIGSERILSYSVSDDENHYQYTSGGDMQVMRRTRAMLVVSFMLSLMLFMGACSSSTGTGNITSGKGSTVSPSPIASAGASSTQAPQTQFPVTIKHLKGDLTLEQKPEKIAVLDTKFVDQLVTLEEQPAGSVTAAGSNSDFPEYLMDKLTDVKVLGTRDEPNLEAVAAMNPDVIICTGFQEKIYDSLSKIAPTIMLDFDEDWRETLITFGKIVGKDQVAEQVLEAYKDKTAKLKADLAAKLNGETVALIRPRNDSIRVHTPGHRTGAILYNDLGLKVPEAVGKETDTAYHIPLEALADVGADHYFLLKDDMFKELVEEFQNTTTWKTLEPVKQNHVYTVDSTLWIAYYGPIAINMIVDQVGEALLGTH
ncbi:AraC family transcriptional regulator [Paenibacillus eucommiae]|uniref:Iron complex transport system substrate-binding protein n=1 Tax=Paenibacillus eucommiae TaxID=1355755 RepID=A0ABS4J308_9BACL|nr:AraC family transcriptional regulator [Paenibacillus eucommiae]MBP1994208.1 iron complex transport system substrate-binding protein [Paenibacillus eucommiae]